MDSLRRAVGRLLVALGAVATPAVAVQADDPCVYCDSTWESVFGSGDDGSILNRKELTGDWMGARTGLADEGITFELLGTQFYQGVTAGGRNNDWEYGGKLDYLMHVDGGKAGLWEGLFIDLHGESRLGQAVNNIDGLMTPSNIAMVFPKPNENVTALTGFKITQALSPNFAVFGGKINTLDEYPLRFSPALGLDRPGVGGFMNTSLVFNPILGRTIGYSMLGVGAAYLQNGQPVATIVAFDPRERSTIGLQDPYDRGVVIMPEVIIRLKPFGLPGMYNFGGTYSNAEYRSVDRASYLIVPDIGVVGGTENGSWALYSNFFQALWVDPCDESRTWGLFGQFGISDGNPNPIRYVANGGIAGRSMIPHRELDTFGAGFFYLGLSSNFKALAAGTLPQQDEYGMEFFYNLALTPWCRLTADLQVARPSTQFVDTAIIPGVRMSVIF